MLPSKNRLKLKRGHTRKFTAKVESTDFVIKIGGNRDYFRAAVVVSKDTAKKAVDRNRIRRLLTTALKKLETKNLEMVVIVKKNIAGQKEAEVRKNLGSLLKKI